VLHGDFFLLLFVRCLISCFPFSFDLFCTHNRCFALEYVKSVEINSR
jgi:hypothetical protein